MTFKDWKYEGWDEAFKIVLIDYKLCANPSCKYYLKKRKKSRYHLEYRLNELPKIFDNYKVLGWDVLFDEKWTKKWVKGVILEGLCCQNIDN